MSVFYVFRLSRRQDGHVCAHKGTETNNERGLSYLFFFFYYDSVNKNMLKNPDRLLNNCFLRKVFVQNTRHGACGRVVCSRSKTTVNNCFVSRGQKHQKKLNKSLIFEPSHSCRIEVCFIRVTPVEINRREKHGFFFLTYYISRISRRFKM